MAQYVANVLKNCLWVSSYLTDSTTHIHHTFHHINSYLDFDVSMLDIIIVFTGDQGSSGTKEKFSRRFTGESRGFEEGTEGQGKEDEEISENWEERKVCKKSALLKLYFFFFLYSDSFQYLDMDLKDENLFITLINCYFYCFYF